MKKETEREGGTQNYGEWVATQNRLLKAGLRNRDDEAVGMVLSNITNKFDEDFAERYFVLMVSRMIDEEDFSFVDDE